MLTDAGAEVTIFLLDNLLTQTEDFPKCVARFRSSVTRRLPSRVADFGKSDSENRSNGGTTSRGEFGDRKMGRRFARPYRVPMLAMGGFPRWRGPPDSAARCGAFARVCVQCTPFGPGTGGLHTVKTLGGREAHPTPDSAPRWRAFPQAWAPIHHEPLPPIRWHPDQDAPDRWRGRPDGGFR
jgi:hypothetical protein